MPPALSLSATDRAALIAELDRHIRSIRAEVDALGEPSPVAAAATTTLRHDLVNVEDLFGVLRALLCS
jgi:hypothetical protein